MSSCNESPLLTALQIHYAELTAFLTRKFGCANLAADVVQETCLHIQRGQRSQLACPRAYLFKMATHLAIDRLRQNQMHARYLSYEPPPEDPARGAPSAETILEHQQRLAFLNVAINELPPKCREVFLLRKLEGMEQSDIAQQLGISLNMVQKHLRKALAHCRARLAQLSE